MYVQDDFVTLQMAWKPIVVHYTTSTSVTWKLKLSSAQTLRTDFTLK